MPQENDSKFVLLTGATGYVGARLLPLLEEELEHGPKQQLEHESRQDVQDGQEGEPERERERQQEHQQGHERDQQFEHTRKLTHFRLRCLARDPEALRNQVGAARKEASDRVNQATPKSSQASGESRHTSLSPTSSQATRESSQESPTASQASSTFGQAGSTSSQAGSTSSQTSSTSSQTSSTSSQTSPMSSQAGPTSSEANAPSSSANPTSSQAPRESSHASSEASTATEIVAGDVLEVESLERALADVHTAYYLIHLMSGSEEFEKQDRQAALNFGAAAAKAGVKRIIYLGGLGDDNDPELSPHLRSRHEVGEILRQSGVETIEFRASAVIGAGSLSFELVRSLTNRLPVMICPRWLSTPTQPIAIDDVLAYLLAALKLPPGNSRVIEIGGADVTTYGGMIREYARQMNLSRLLIPVPFLTPYLSGLWLTLVTPTKSEVGRHLIEGLKNPTVVMDKTAAQIFPIQPIGIREAMGRALGSS